MSNANSVTALPDPIPVTRGQGGFSEQSVTTLTQRGMDTESAHRAGMKPALAVADLPEELAANPYAADALPGILIPWRDVTSGEAVWQFRPDAPLDNPDGDPVKYVFGRGVSIPVGLVRQGTDPTGTVLLVEGTFQSIMAARYADPTVTVLSIAGCWNFSHDGIPNALPLVAGRKVVVILDADAASNHQVFSAGMRLKAVGEAEGATEVSFARIPASGSTGLDDMLSNRPPDTRASYLETLIRSAKAKPADRVPEKKKEKKRADTSYRDLNDDLMVAQLATDLLDRFPALVTQEGAVAFYQRGYYASDLDALPRHLFALMGDYHRSGHVETVRQALVALLYDAGRIAPERPSQPLVCVRNGMLDLRTGQLLDHDPGYLALRFIDVDYDPDCPTPLYDAWCEKLGITDQRDDLEEITSLMLDPSATPNRCLFLYGPTRTGKGTWLRMMKAVVGAASTSAVSLHDLADDKFSAAQIYGKALNSAGDLSAREVTDIEKFKLMLGEDPIHANRKYGRQFTFTNQALFAFSANEIPAVNDPGGGFLNKVKPFRFAKSFQGQETPLIEQGMIADELPGILARWVTAWQRLKARGHYLETAPDVVEEFEQATDQVRAFVAEKVVIHQTTATVLPDNQCSTIRDAYRSYKAWADETGRRPLGERNFSKKLKAIRGVVDVRTASTKAAAVNVTVVNGTKPHLSIAKAPIA